MSRVPLLALLVTISCGSKATEGTLPGECTNGVDDDGNGLMDCDDAGCMSSPDCADTGTEPADDGSGGGADDGSTGDDGGTGEDGGTGDDGSTGDDGGAGEDGGTGDDGGAGDDGSTPDGASLYDTHCAGCHGDSGQGASGPPLADQFAFHTDAELVETILGGSGSMPAIAVTEDEAYAIVTYARTFF